MPKILLYHIRHRHPQCGGKILRGHHALLVRISQQGLQASCKPGRVAGRIKLNGQFFTLGHLPKVRKIRTNNGDAVGAREVGYATATGR